MAVTAQTRTSSHSGVAANFLVLYEYSDGTVSDLADPEYKWPSSPFFQTVKCLQTENITTIRLRKIHIYTLTQHELSAF